MKYWIVSCALLYAGVSFSQSKKKQIEKLQHQLDSVTKANQMLVFFQFEEQKSTQTTLAQLEKENVLLRKIMVGYVHTIDELNSLNDSLENQLKDSFNVVGVKLNSQNEGVQSGLVNDNPFGDGVMNSKDFNRECFPANSIDSGVKHGKGRTRLNNVQINDIEIKEDVKIYYKLTVDEKGRVVDFSFYSSKTTTSDQTLINQIGYRIKEQVKYNRASGSPLVYQDYRISVKAN